MLQEIARYGVFKKRDAPTEEPAKVVETVDKPVSNSKPKVKRMTDPFNTLEIYDYDVDYDYGEVEG